MTTDDANRTNASIDERTSGDGQIGGRAVDAPDAPGPSADGRRDSKLTLGRRGLLKTVGAAIAGGLVGTGAATETVSADPEVGGGPWIAHHGLTASEYQDRVDEYLERNFRPVHVAGHGVDDEARYAAIWEKGGPPWAARHGLSAGQYQREFEQLTGEGYRPVHVSGFSVGEASRYAAIWEKRGGPPWVARHGMTSGEYQEEFERHVDRGYRLTHVSGHGAGGEARYAAIWEKRGGPAWAARHGLTASEYQQAVDDFDAKGYRLADVSAFSVGDSPRFAAIFERSESPGWVARHGLTAAEYQAEFDELRYQGYRLTDVSGYGVESGGLFSNVASLLDGPDRYAALWEADGLAQRDIDAIDSRIEGYVNQYGVPGLSVAISRDERLVFAKGYGLADRDAGEELRPSHRFRIASISKPITAVAIRQLEEAGRLRLDREVFGSRGVLGTKYGTPTYGDSIDSENPDSITVQHLLEHASGWQFADGNDPMFDHHGKSQDELISHVVANHSLSYEPGTGTDYLNFGYLLLGRVIEAITGRSYEAYVKDAVLSPCGIDSMAIAGDTENERKSDEVVYHGSGAYDYEIGRMDAHGGWIATPIDLLRFVARVDGFDEKPDLLDRDTEDEMFDRERPDRDYGEGWITRPTWRGHDGSLPGSIGYLVRRDDGFSFAALANSRPSNSRQAINDLRRTVNDAIGDVRDWPEYDLF